jgi:hypothetical protein
MDSAVETIGSRLHWFITENYGGVPAYAERFDFNKSQIYRVINDSTSPRLDTCAEYARTGLNIHWLGTGSGQWWSPDEIGHELARKKGALVKSGSGSGITTLDYAALVRTVFELVEESVVEKLTRQIHRDNFSPNDLSELKIDQ